MALLIIEDDPKVQVFLKECLEWDFAPVETSSHLPSEAELEGMKVKPSAIILDRLIGNIDSKVFLPVVKRIFPQTPVLILSAINNPVERSELLDLGADDYMGKPFSIVELKARIRALLRRTSTFHQTHYIQLENTVLDTNQRTLNCGEARVSLSAKEYELFYVFAKNIGRVFSKYELMDKVWQSNLEIESNVLEVTIMNIRKKLQEINSPLKISTKRNIGYWIEV